MNTKIQKNTTANNTIIVVPDDRKFSIPEELYDLYNEYYQHGDFATICEMAYGHRQSIKVKRALEAGVADLELIQAIRTFYEGVREKARIYEIE